MKSRSLCTCKTRFAARSVSNGIFELKDRKVHRTNTGFRKKKLSKLQKKMYKYMNQQKEILKNRWIFLWYFEIKIIYTNLKKNTKN